MVNKYMKKESPGEILNTPEAIYLSFEINTKQFHRSYIAVDFAIKRIRIVSW